MRTRTVWLWVIAVIGAPLAMGLAWVSAPGPLRSDLIDERPFQESMSRLVQAGRTLPHDVLELHTAAEVRAICMLWNSQTWANTVVSPDLRPKGASWNLYWRSTVPHSDEVILLFLSADGFQDVSFPTSHVFMFPPAGQECVRSQRFAIELRDRHLHLIPLPTEPAAPQE